MVILYSKIR